MTAAPEFRFAVELPPGRPLVPVDVAAFFLDTDRAGVLGRMEDGVISHAWDIGTGEERRELRFFWRSLIAARQSAMGNRPSPIPDAAVYAEVIPTNWSQPAAALIYRRWTCSSTHLGRLIETRLLRVSAHASGPTDSPLILRESAISFLKSRRVL